MSFAGDEDEYQFDDAGGEQHFDYPDDDGGGDDFETAETSPASSGAGASAGLATAAAALSEPASSTRGGYITCSTDDLHKRISSLARHVCEIAFCTEDEALLLLASFKWDPRRVEEALFSGDADALRAKLGIAALGAGPEADARPPLPAGAALTDTFMDDASLEDVTYAEADACARGHWFSNATWRRCVETAMEQFAVRALTLTVCPSHPDCNEIVRPRLFRKFLSPAQYARYREFIGCAFADCGSNVRLCPHPGCTSCVMSDLAIAQDVTCANGHRFCFACKRDAHKPATCAEAERWLAKEKDEGADAKWLLANTKPCPACRKPIEKNQGCMHMTCRKEVGGCSHEFCWVCLGKWSEHARDYYNCNKAPPKTLYDADAAAANKHELAVYAFYSERFHENMRSARIAADNRSKIAGIAETLMNVAGASATETDFMKRAQEVIIRGRHVSAWTYAHAFFAASGSATYKALLEDSQGMMERNLEALHGQMEISAVQRQVLDDPETMAKGLGAGAGAAVGAGSSTTPGKAAAAATASSSSSSSASASGGASVRSGAAVGGAGGPANSPSSSAGGGALSSSSSSSGGPSASGAFEVTTARSRLTDYRQKTTNLLAATDRFISELLSALEVGLLDDGAAYAAAYAAGAAGGAGAGAGGGVARATSSGSGSGRRKLEDGSDRSGGTKKARGGGSGIGDGDETSGSGSGSAGIDADAELAAALAAGEHDDE